MSNKNSIIKINQLTFLISLVGTSCNLVTKRTSLLLPLFVASELLPNFLLLFLEGAELSNPPSILPGVGS